MKKRFIWATALALLFAACGSDDITGNGSSNASSDSEYTSDDFDRTITVTFNSGSTATVSGAGSEQTVSVSGEKVTITNSGDEKVQYELSGTATNGYFKLYSEKKQAIVLNSVSITNSTGAAINVQSGKAVYVVLNGTNTLADGSSYSTTSDEDEKAAFFSEGQLLFSGSGSLTVTAKGKSGIVSDDYVKFSEGTINVNCSTSCSVSNGDTLKPACVKANDEVIMAGGTVTLKSTGTGAKGISCDGIGTFSGGTLTVTVTGSNFGSSSGGGMGPGGNSSDNSVAAKGMKFDDAITISGGNIVVSASNHEGIESKSTITVTGGYVYASSSDDAINASSDLTISGGYVMANSSGNDGIDANGNLYIKGGNVFAIATTSPEVALDANTEGNKQLYITGGNIVAIGGLESGASISNGTAYQSSSYSKGTWYGLYNGSSSVAFAYKVPSNSSMGTPMVVYTTGSTSLYSGVSGSGTSFWNSNGYSSCSGGSTVSLSSYSGGNSGGGPGGGGQHH